MLLITLLPGCRLLHLRLKYQVVVSFVALAMYGARRVRLSGAWHVAAAAATGSKSGRVQHDRHPGIRAAGQREPVLDYDIRSAAAARRAAQRGAFARAPRSVTYRVGRPRDVLNL